MTTHELIERYGVTDRTVRNWRKQGAPLHSVKELELWLASRKNIAPAILAKLCTLPRKGREIPSGIVSADLSAKPSTDSGESEGASHTLRRLEREEVAAYDRLQDALKSDNQVAIREARKGWLEVSELLRKVDLAIEDARRQQGELLPRENIEKAVRFFIYGAHVEFALLASNLPPTLAGRDAPEIGIELESVLRLSWLNGALMSSASCPDYLQPIITKEITTHLAVGPDEVKRRTALFQRALEIVAAEDAG